MRSFFKKLWRQITGKLRCAEMESQDCPQHYRKLQETPMKWKSATGCYHESPKSSLLFTAQTKSYEKKVKSIRKIKNPFEPEDPTILEENACSPGILVPGKEPENFSWSIDEISRIQPANIDSPQFVAEDYDEGKESLAQEAIEKYFSSTHSIVSPADAYQGTWRSPAFSTPTAPNSAKTNSSTPNIAKYRSVQRSEAGSQTMYSFPPSLPPEVEEILKPYFSEVEAQGNVSVDSDDLLLNTSTLRRKLFFNKGDEDLSPVKFTGHHFTPSPQKSNIVSRIEWSTEKRKICGNDSVPSSPDLSPIRTIHREEPDVEMSLGSPDISAISNAEISMVTIGSTKGPCDLEEMVVSMEDHNRIFSSTVMPIQSERFPGGASGTIESSGYASLSQDASSANFFRHDVGC